MIQEKKKSKQNMAIIKKRYILKYNDSVLNHATLHTPPPSCEGGKKTSRQGNSGQLLESSATIANLLL